MLLHTSQKKKKQIQIDDLGKSHSKNKFSIIWRKIIYF